MNTFENEPDHLEATLDKGNFDQGQPKVRISFRLPSAVLIHVPLARTLNIQYCRITTRHHLHLPSLSFF